MQKKGLLVCPELLLTSLPSCMLATVLFLGHFVTRSVAQGPVVSSTAAWSSQIVAFWGAIVVGHRASAASVVTNPVTALYTVYSILRRAIKIHKLLQNDDWYLHSSWESGKTRTDIAMVAWKTSGDLWRLALQASTQIEAIGTDWQCLVLGRKLKHETIVGDDSPHVCWIQSPRCEPFAGARSTVSGQPYFPFSEQQVSEAVMSFQTHRSSVQEVADILMLNQVPQASRVTYLTEVRREMQEQMTFGRHITSLTRGQPSEVPFVSILGKTGAYGSTRSITLDCSAIMYIAIHLTVAIAIGLMGAASGRGFAVWLMMVRPTISHLGTSGLKCNDILLFLLSMDNASFMFEMPITRGYQIAGDVIIEGMSWSRFGLGALVPILELGIISGGWVYGATRVERLKPTGVVGNGMLWLAIAVGIALSLRALIGVRDRVNALLVGLFVTQEYTRRALGPSVSISTASFSIGYNTNPELHLITSILREVRDDNLALTTAAGILRRPNMCSVLETFVADSMHKYKYNAQWVVEKKDPPDTESVTVSSSYPWFLSGCCVLLTAATACISVAYAYIEAIPAWTKLIMEGCLVLSGVGWATLERYGELEHNRESYVCHMIATMVISAVWYVGVKDIG